MRIMIADGDKLIRSELKTLLTGEGYDVDLIADGITAINTSGDMNTVWSFWIFSCRNWMEGV